MRVSSSRDDASEHAIDLGVAPLPSLGLDVDEKPSRPDGAGHHALYLEPCPELAHRLHGRLHDRKRHAEIDQRRNAHVPRDAAEPVEE